MALQQPGFTLPGFVAGADLTDHQFKVVTITAENTVGLCGNTDVPIGILQNAPDDGEQCQIMVSGLSKVILDDGADSAVSAGDLVAMTNQNGAVANGNDDTAANVADGNVIIGQAYKDAAAGSTGSVLFNCQSYWGVVS